MPSEKPTDTPPTREQQLEKALLEMVDPLVMSVGEAFEMHTIATRKGWNERAKAALSPRRPTEGHRSSQ